MEYPQYRKYSNGKNYFKVISATELEEIHFIGHKCFVNTMEAKILPDRNFIYDLTFDLTTCVEISADEYEQKLNDCRKGS